jgi:hypothetical protein
MVIPDLSNKFFIQPCWDQQFKHLDYDAEPFNDPDTVAQWRTQGYQGLVTGDMCDMAKPQPSWNSEIIRYFSALGWQDVGTSYYRMTTGTVMPVHSDLYVKYVKMFNLQGHEQRIRRAVIFLEDWKSGHHSELDGQSLVHWRAGDVVSWPYDAPHSAANLGLEPRYTLQITGHVK